MRVHKDGRIEGEAVFLRPITRDDTEDIIRWRNSDAVRPYFIYQQPFTREGHLKWLETMIETKNAYQFIVCEKETGRAAGCVYLRDHDRTNRKIEYGIFMDGSAGQHRGLGTESLSLVAQFAFDALKVHKVFGRIFADNPASLRISEKAGFLREAYFKDEVYLNGSYRDVVFVAKIQNTGNRSGEEA